MKTHGSIRRFRKDGRDTWVVNCGPHVMARLKRVFGGIDVSDHGSAPISDTPALSRDLLWFTGRYPMEITPGNLAHLERRAREHEEREELVEQILRNPAGHQARAFELAVPARDYQKVAAELYLRSGSLLVGDQLGLGKTVTAIVPFTDPRTLPAVVVTLPHLPAQWAAEIKRFAPHLRVALPRSAKPEDMTRPRRGKSPEPWDVCVINYHKLSGLAGHLAEVANSVVFDEAQELRRDDSAKYRSALHLARKARFRMGLSGTPIFNYGGEIYPVVDALEPDALGTREEFQREWCTGGFGRLILKDPRAFGLHLRDAGLFLRRTRAEVGREVPMLTRHVQEIDADLAKLDRIESDAVRLAQVVLTRGGKRGEQMMAASELSAIVRHATGVAKAPAIAAFARMLADGGDPILVYGWHIEVYEILRDLLKDLKPAFFTGQESPAQKAEVKRRFVSGETKVLVMSLRAGQGIDGLQAVCSTVLFAELDWSPGVIEQCIGRVLRDGQVSPVLAYFPVADSGSDPLMVDVLGLKRRQVEGLIDPHADAIAESQVDPEHVRKLAEQYLAGKGIAIPDRELEVARA